jgi:hypothetical protein
MVTGTRHDHDYLLMISESTPTINSILQLTVTVNLQLTVVP